MSFNNDFSNVECAFVYYDQNVTSDPSFQYPNNNIQKIDLSINQTFDSVINNIPSIAGSKNFAFIPDKNSNNLSKKQIQGFIASNNIGALLSIKPYDPDFIDGRGFATQFQINDSCLTYADRVKNKMTNTFSSTKNDSNTIKKFNFANIVRRPNNLLVNSCSTSIDYSSITNYNVPLFFFKTNRGRYLTP